jgi:hypothetical protein
MELVQNRVLRVVSEALSLQVLLPDIYVDHEYRGQPYVLPAHGCASDNSRSQGFKD